MANGSLRYPLLFSMAAILPILGKKMAHRLFLLMAVLHFCIAMVSSDAKMKEEPPQVAKGPNRRLMALVDCGERCKARCRLHSRQKICTRACGTCCARCKCVPPGTYGNREACGKCYTDMVTHGNKPKCP